jgi:hypothetical protein
MLQTPARDERACHQLGGNHDCPCWLLQTPARDEKPCNRHFSRAVREGLAHATVQAPRLTKGSIADEEQSCKSHASISCSVTLPGGSVLHGSPCAPRTASPGEEPEMGAILLLIVPEPVRWYFAAASPDPRFGTLHCKTHIAVLQNAHRCIAKCTFLVGRCIANPKITHAALQSEKLQLHEY